MDIYVYSKILSYLPFKAAISFSQINRKFRSYSTDHLYTNLWKRLINRTYGETVNYEYNLRRIWSDIKVSENTYNCMIYANLVKYLDPVTQAVIYYKQSDMKSFNSLSGVQMYIAYALMKDDKIDLGCYTTFQPLVDIMNGLFLDPPILNRLLLTMAQEGSPLGIAMMIAAGACVHTENDKALQLASQHGNLNSVRCLLLNKADIHAERDKALRLACLYRHLKVVKYLVEHGANINPGGRNSTPLGLASERGYLDVVKYLIDHGARIQDCRVESLYEAMKVRDWDMIEFLKKRHVHYHPGVLEMAVRYDCIDIMKYLARDWDEIIMFRYPYQILYKACIDGKLEAVKYILGLGLDVNGEYSSGIPLLYACYGGSLPVVEYLVKKGANIHDCKYKALINASKRGNLNVVKYIMKYGIGYFKRKKAIKKARKYNKKDVVECLQNW